MTSAQGIKFGSPPRKVRIRNSKLPAAMAICLVAMLFTGVGLYVLYMALLSTATDFYGKPATGIVVEHQEHDDGEGTSYKLIVRYYANGHIYSRGLSVNRHSYHSVHDGANVNLLYLPQLPKFAKFHEPHIGEHATIVYWAFALFWNACIILTSFALSRPPWRQYNLIRNGIVVDGTVTNKESKNNDGSMEHHLQYKYLVNGSPVTDDTTVSPKRFQDISIGQNMTVFYTPGNATENLIYEFSYLEVAQ